MPHEVSVRLDQDRMSEGSEREEKIGSWIRVQSLCGIVMPYVTWKPVNIPGSRSNLLSSCVTISSLSTHPFEPYAAWIGFYLSFSLPSLTLPLSHLFLSPSLINLPPLSLSLPPIRHHQIDRRRPLLHATVSISDDITPTEPSYDFSPKLHGFYFHLDRLLLVIFSRTR